MHFKRLSTCGCVNSATRCRTRAVLASVAGACIASALPTGAPAQGLPPLTQTLTIEDEGITISYPEGWSLAPPRYTNADVLLNIPAEAQGSEAALGITRIIITTERRRDRDDAVHRLQEIDAEVEVPSTFLTIGGWPALQRRYLMPMEQPGVNGSPGELSLRVTTAIAAGSLLVKLQGFIPPEGDPALADVIEAIGRSVVFTDVGDRGIASQDVERLRTGPRLRSSLPLQPESDSPTVVPAPRGGAPSVDSSDTELLGSTQRVQTGETDSEIEISVSNDGQNVVIVNNSRDFATSNDGGQSFPTTGVVDPGFPANGDPSIAFGASGAFYYAFIGFPGAGMCSTSVTASTNDGNNFNFRNHAELCDDAAGPFCFPDQEHIAADRFNLSSDGEDQIYSTWRDFQGGNCTTRLGPVVPTIVCSTDGAMTWKLRTVVDDQEGDFPRITVDQDGFVYVVYRRGANIMLNKFSSCDDGLEEQDGFPSAVATGISEVACPAVPGLDRCDDGNRLSSHMVAVDDTDPDHVYVAYADNTAFDPDTFLGNEDVVIRISLDGGENWEPQKEVNDPAIEARRYMPWVCATNGTAFVSWYDRRAATAAANDLTEFFGGSAFVDAQEELSRGPEFRISEVADPNCASGWPDPPRAETDSESCAPATQPQLAGLCTSSGMCQATLTCSNNPNRMCMRDSDCVFPSTPRTRCDFSDCGGAGMNAGDMCQCAAQTTCNTGDGTPKYGDYNGNACIGGQFYTAWASATSPPEITPRSTDIDVFFAAFAPNHFKSYRVATAPRTPEFEPRDVFLEDQFGATTATVLRPYTFLNPVNKDGAATVDPTAHLKCYRIGDTGPRFERRDVSVRNQFGDQTLTVFRPWELCLPAEKDGVASDLNLDHFKCYRAVAAQRRPRFEPREVSLEDQFETKETRVRGPFTFCNPVSKDGEEIRNPKLHLTCYFIQNPPRFARRDVFVEDQFGSETLRVSRPWTLCLPSTKVLL